MLAPNITLSWPQAISIEPITNALVAYDPSITVKLYGNHTVMVTKGTNWVIEQITAAQALFNTTPLTLTIQMTYDAKVSQDALVAALDALDPTVALSLTPDIASLYKATPWLPEHVLAAQTVLDSTPEMSAQWLAQRNIEAWPVETKALALLLIDQINILRGFVSLAPISEEEAVTAIIAKAGELLS